MSALGTSINISPSKGGFGVSIVSAGMSFSVASTVFLWNTYAHKASCEEVKIQRKIPEKSENFYNFFYNFFCYFYIFILFV